MFKSQEYNSIKVVLLVIAIALLGWFIFGKFNTGQTGQVIDTTHFAVIPVSETRALPLGISPQQLSVPSPTTNQFCKLCYIVDDGNNRVQQFTNTGYSSKFGTYGTGNGHFIAPVAIARSVSGKIYVTDNNNHRVEVFSSNGSYVTQWGTQGNGNGQFMYPDGIAVSPITDKVYVSDTTNNNIQVFTPTGGYIAQWGTQGNGNGQFLYASGIAFDSVGNVYVADAGKHTIQKFTSTGGFITEWGGFGTGNGQFASSSPYFLAIDSSDNIYVADAYNNRVEKFTSSGTYITQWPGTFTGAVLKGIGLDPLGNVYVSDSFNHIEKFTSTGTYIEHWGNTGSGNGQFYIPLGMIFY